MYVGFNRSDKLKKMKKKARKQRVKEKLYI